MVEGAGIESGLFGLNEHCSTIAAVIKAKRSRCCGGSWFKTLLEGESSSFKNVFLVKTGDGSPCNVARRAIDTPPKRLVRDDLLSDLAN